MRFHLSEEQRAIQDAIRGTLADCWQLEQQHAFANGDADFDETSWNALMALGLGSILMPDSGMGLLDAALVCEVMGEAAAPGPLITQLLSVAAVARSSNDAAKLHLAGLEAGSTVAALAFCDSPYVQSARSAALFLTGSHESGIALVEAGDGVSIEAVKSTDRTRPVSKVSFDGATTNLLFPAVDPMVGKLSDEFEARLGAAAAEATAAAAVVEVTALAWRRLRAQRPRLPRRSMSSTLRWGHVPQSWRRRRRLRRRSMQPSLSIRARSPPHAPPVSRRRARRRPRSVPSWRGALRRSRRRKRTLDEAGA